MRASFSLTLLLMAACVGSASAAELQWQSHRQTSPAPAASTSQRTAARFQRPSVEDRAKRPTASEPALLEPVDASPIQQASHDRPAPKPTARPRRTVRVAQADTRETLPAPPSTSRSTSEMPYGDYEGYTHEMPMMGDSSDVIYEGGEFCGPECDCGFPEPGCGFMEPGCGFIEAGCGVSDCCCGEVGCVGDCCGDCCGCCDTCGWGFPWFGQCAQRGAIPICLYLPPIMDLTFSAGVHGFKGPLDEYRDRGNFGIHAGFNAGGKMAWLPWPGLGYQFGYQAAASQFHGSSVNANYDDSHAQHFITTGLFRRSCVGFSYGVVYDMMRDERIESVSFHQVRGLISVTNCHGHEVGFMFAAGDDKQTLIGQIGAVPDPREYDPAEQYLGFWRFHSCKGGDILLKAGGGGGYGILGSELNAPLNDWWSLNGGFTYFIPDGSGQLAAEEEGWNLGLNLVWHYGGSAKRSFKNPYRPMFDVADNGSFFVGDVD